MRNPLIAIVVLAVTALPLGAQQMLGKDATSWKWDGSVPSNGTVKIYNVNGAVSVRQSADGNAHVQAEKRAHRGGDPTTVHFAVVREGNAVAICALWRDDATCDINGPHDNEIRGRDDDHRQDVEVGFSLQIPNGAHLVGSTVNGDMSVDRVSSDVVARTVNGSVRVEDVGGSVNARTVNGDVIVATRGGPVSGETVNGSVRAMMGSQGTTDMHFRSVNGDINVDAPTGLNADVSLNTVNGEIDSTFPLSFDRHRRHADGTVGKGGPRLYASSVNGSITLK